MYASMKFPNFLISKGLTFIAIIFLITMLFWEQHQCYLVINYESCLSRTRWNHLRCTLDWNTWDWLSTNLYAIHCLNPLALPLITQPSFDLLWLSIKTPHFFDGCQVKPDLSIDSTHQHFSLWLFIFHLKQGEINKPFIYIQMQLTVWAALRWMLELDLTRLWKTIC